MDSKKRKAHRPCEYTKEIASEICARLVQGKSLRRICEADDMPAASSVFLWLIKFPEFSEQYTRAKAQGSEALADEITDIADNGTNDWMTVEKGKGNFVPILDREHVERSKLRIESRKWLLAKMQPKKYGEKIDVTSGNKPIPFYGGRAVKSIDKSGT